MYSSLFCRFTCLFFSLASSSDNKRNNDQFLIFFIQVSMQEARLAREKMHGRLACGRPLIIRLASEKSAAETAESSQKLAGVVSRSGHSGSTSGQMSRSAKIAAIKNKLKVIEEDGHKAKKQKQAEHISS